MVVWSPLGLLVFYGSSGPPTLRSGSRIVSRSPKGRDRGRYTVRLNAPRPFGDVDPDGSILLSTI